MTAAALIARSSQIGLRLSVEPPDGLKIDFEGDPPPPDFIAQLAAGKKAIIERLKSRPMIRLSTLCVRCGTICTGTRPDQYRLVDPNDQAGPRVHTKCLHDDLDRRRAAP